MLDGLLKEAGGGGWLRLGFGVPRMVPVVDMAAVVLFYWRDRQWRGCGSRVRGQ
jgi:hypothetical protein